MPHYKGPDQDGDSGSSFSLVELPSESPGGIVVNYTDPNEAEEQRRLRMLLKGEEPQEDQELEPVSKGKRPTKAAKPRRSGRHKA